MFKCVQLSVFMGCLVAACFGACNDDNTSNDRKRRKKSSNYKNKNNTKFKTVYTVDLQQVNMGVSECAVIRSPGKMHHHHHHQQCSGHHQCCSGGGAAVVVQSGHHHHHHHHHKMNNNNINNIGGNGHHHLHHAHQEVVVAPLPSTSDNILAPFKSKMKVLKKLKKKMGLGRLKL